MKIIEEQSMQGIKRTVASLLVLVFLLTCICVPAMASDVEEKVTEIEVQVMDEGEYEQYLASLENPSSARGIGLGVATLVVCRSGNTTNCDVFFNWAGYMISSFRHKQLIFTSTSALNPVTYATFGYGTSYLMYSTPASTVCSITLGRIQIPTGVTKIKISSNSTEVYSPTDPAGWYSVYFADNSIPVN